MQSIVIQKGDYIISTNTDHLDVFAIHDFLNNHSHWSKGIPIEKVKQSLDHSLNFGLYKNNEQIGFARIISDYATIAYLGDVYVIEQYRGLGLSKWLMETVMLHPNLQGLRRWILLTGDAHGLYKQFGWEPLPKPELYMEFYNPNVYV